MAEGIVRITNGEGEDCLVDIITEALENEDLGVELIEGEDGLELHCESDDDKLPTEIRVKIPIVRKPPRDECIESYEEED